MLTPTKSAETWQTLIALRCRREIIERWLASQTVSGSLRETLHAMLREVEDHLQLLTNATSK